MKSKTSEQRHEEKVKKNKTIDFSDLYKSAAETTSVLIEKRKIIEKDEDCKSETYRAISKGSNRNKNKKVTADTTSLEKTLNNKNDILEHQKPKVKSIMKNLSMDSEDIKDESIVDVAINRRKKRNKSVSFMLDDNEVAVKKTKSGDSLKIVLSNEVSNMSTSKRDSNNKSYKTKNFYQRKHIAEKENKMSQVQQQEVENNNNKIKSKSEKEKHHKLSNTASETHNESNFYEKKKKVKKINKVVKLDDTSESVGNDSSSKEDQATEVKGKKHRKKKHQTKSGHSSESMEIEGEPQTKLRRKDAKPDVIAEDLGNLSIGDNAHSLINLLDGMSVADKNKRKNNKLRHKKDKQHIPAGTSSSETVDLEKIEEGKEKVIWKKRKWNKDKRGEVDEYSLVTSVIIENLPLKIMLTYKKLLLEHFSKFGLIKKIGIAEVYPTEESKPVFTTTINFINEAAATQALGEDNTLFEGSRLRVKRPLPPAQTTLVIRSYGDITEQSLSTLFISAGKIRNIKQLVKGKKSMATAFVEFDGPVAVNRAIKMAEDAKIGGKKIHVSKFELRSRKTKDTGVKPKNTQESENEGDSEDSND